MLLRESVVREFAPRGSVRRESVRCGTLRRDSVLRAGPRQPFGGRRVPHGGCPAPAPAAAQRPEPLHRGWVYRAASGPVTTRISTYAVANGPSSGSMPAVTARPAMTIENSPRETSAPPARQRPRSAIPARRAAQYPVATLVSAVTRASSSAGSRTGGMLVGSVLSPKKTKKTAAKRSRSGLSRVCAPSAASPERAMPTRKAPTAADTWSCCARPATSRVSPRTTSSSFSGSSCETNFEITRP